MKTVLISGGNRGIGLETAKKFSKHGYIVFLGVRSHENGLIASHELERLGFKNIIPLLLDITIEKSVKEACKFIGQHTFCLDVLINNAGIRGQQPQPPTSVDIDSIRSIFATNLFGTIVLTQAAMPLLKKSNAPRIVNVSSELASLTLHDNEHWKFYSFKDAGYGPSKTALNAYTVMLAYELRDTAFKINAVDPGYTATEFNGFKGTGDVSDAADLIFKYATLDQSGPTGQFHSKEGQLPW
ncbi:SDR family NAD(P)-dependent oxidoreductase [Pedobacter miscanthi]|uniref:Short-chain dehydrogenase n=1 Tax=Pedobacter miscanthi TaxID=2259170 RepID=A0A366LEA6_9SPHI|nr:SDR family NAD(P)-dependent oxidoreductase [Pedobacter miscanthi]RBQ11482.1 short-chain dehydrogenase [Pedobacter miscanthi]